MKIRYTIASQVRETERRLAQLEAIKLIGRGFQEVPYDSFA